MVDIFDQIASEIDTGGASAIAPSPSVAINTPAPSVDIFDRIASEYSPASGVEDNSYLGRLFSTMFSKKDLGADLYAGTIGGIKSMGSTLKQAYDDVNNPESDLPEILKNQGEFFGAGNPVKTLGATAYNFYKDKPPAQQIYDTGKLAASFVPVVGPTLYDKAQQYVNPDLVPATTPEEDARAIRTNALGTIATLGAVKGGGALLKGAGSALDDAATATREKAMGIQYGDKKGGLGKNSVFLDESGNVVPRTEAVDVTSSVQNKMQTLKDDGFFDRASNVPTERLGMLQAENAATQKAIGTSIVEADKVVGNQSFMPSWERAKAYIASKRDSVGVDLAPELQTIISDYAKNPQTGLQKIITLKNQLRRDASFASKEAPVKAELYTQAYYDLQKLGEEVFDGALPSKAGEFAKTNELASAQHSMIDTLPKVTARDNPGIAQTLMTPTGSGPFVGAAGIGSMVAPQLAIPLAGATWVGRGVYKGLKNTKPITFSNMQEGLGTAATEAGRVLSSTAKAVPFVESLALDNKNEVMSSVFTRSDEGKSVNGNPKNESTMDKVFSPSEGVENMSRLETPEQQQEFKAKVDTIATNLETDPTFLMQAMNFETGGTLDSAQKNKAGSGATGLIQFMPATAKALTGADTKEAAIKIMESMNPVEQLDYVQKYLAPFKGKLNSLDDVYMAILWPKAVGADPDYAIFREGTKAYLQNKGLDLNADGIVTKAEATSKVRSFNV